MRNSQTGLKFEGKQKTKGQWILKAQSTSVSQNRHCDFGTWPNCSSVATPEPWLFTRIGRVFFFFCQCAHTSATMFLFQIKWRFSVAYLNWACSGQRLLQLQLQIQLTCETFWKFPFPSALPNWDETGPSGACPSSADKLKHQEITLYTIESSSRRPKDRNSPNTRPTRTKDWSVFDLTGDA